MTQYRSWLRLISLSLRLYLSQKNQGVGRWTPEATRSIACVPNFPFFLYFVFSSFVISPDGVESPTPPQLINASLCYIFSAKDSLSITVDIWMAMYAFDFLIWKLSDNFSTKSTYYIRFIYFSKTAILNFNEEDVNQCNNFAPENHICIPPSTLLDELHWNLGQ